MSLEGRIRELGLHEVCQLLGLSRKTGQLRLRAPLHGLAAEIVMAHGAVVDAAVWSIDDAPDGERPHSPPPAAADARRIESCVLELLTWTDGEFRFVVADASALRATAVRIAIEPVLVEAAQRAEVWERVADRVPSVRAIPSFVDVEPQQLPLLKLVPQEWEILTRVDGKRDLAELATALGRDLLEVVETVHRLIGAGLLALVEEPRAPRRHDTPPASSPAFTSLPAAGLADGDDLWIPDDDRDVVFDPVRTGVFTPEGLPRLRTPLASPMVLPAAVVASHPGEPSLHRGEDAAASAGDDPAKRCRLGDEAARRGDLASALAHWSASLRLQASAPDRPGVDADRIREAIALAARLHALLHPSLHATLHDAPEN